MKAEQQIKLTAAKWAHSALLKIWIVLQTPDYDSGRGQHHAFIGEEGLSDIGESVLELQSHLEALPPTIAELTDSLDACPTVRNAVTIHGIAHRLELAAKKIKTLAKAAAKRAMPPGLTKAEYPDGNAGYNVAPIRLDEKAWNAWRSENPEHQEAEAAHAETTAALKIAQDADKITGDALTALQAPFRKRDPKGKGAFYIKNNTKRAKG